MDGPTQRAPHARACDRRRDVRRCQRDRASEQGDARTAPRRLVSQREAHLSRGAIAQKANRIDVLDGRPRGDHDTLAGKAAAGYAMAKLHIKLINDVAEVINSDPAVHGRLAVAWAHLEEEPPGRAEKVANPPGTGAVPTPDRDDAR